MTSMMASRRKISLAIPVLASIYHGLNKISCSSQLDQWDKEHGKFLENNLQALIDNVGLKSTTPLGGEDQGVGKTLSKVKEPLTPIPKVVTQYKKRKLKSSKAALKEVVCTSTNIEKHPLVLPFSTQVPQDTSQSTNEDQNWKRKHPNPLNAIGHPMVSLHDKPQVSDKSIGRPTSKVKSSSKASSLPHDKALKRQTLNEITRVPPMTNTSVSIFEGKNNVFNRKKEFILGLWEDIFNRLSKTRAELLSSYREQITEIFEDMKKANILDLSPLECLLDSLFELAASYDQERSNLADKTSQDEKLEQISKAKEHLESFKLEASKKVKKVSSSEKKLKRVVKKMQTLQQERKNLEGVIEATQKEVEEIQAKVSAAETEVSLYDNINLLTVDDSANLEEKKKNLETNCQELINYKFCLD
ncbi:uncharacterized protein [Nicotiana sylvestris]|uniref:uncharacterized protein n=1 Tax=Nicotiana sylvestris TaxID=4096 RepID=UPI00388CA6A8